MSTFEAYVNTLGIRIYTTKGAKPNPEFKDGTAWTVELCRGNKPPNKVMKLPFYQGSAHKKPPTLVDVLACLHSDASGVQDGRTFEDWAGDFGYDTDSRKAESTFKACQKIARQLRDFLGAEDFDAFMAQENDY